MEGTCSGKDAWDLDDDTKASYRPTTEVIPHYMEERVSSANSHSILHSQDGSIQTTYSVHLLAPLHLSHEEHAQKNARGALEEVSIYIQSMERKGQ